jgi:hypothetical protein
MLFTKSKQNGLRQIGSNYGKENGHSWHRSFSLNAYSKAAIIWGIISLGTSGIKTHSGDCDKRYQIEKFVNGSLFCEDKK